MMPRTAAKITQATLERSVRAVARAGVAIGSVEIKPDGTLVIHTVDGSMAKPMLPRQQEANEWDEWAAEASQS